MINDTINQTFINNLTPESFINTAHKFTAVPSVLISWISTIVLLGFFGIWMARKSETFWQIYFLVATISGLITFSVIFMPNTVQLVADLFKDIF